MGLGPTIVDQQFQYHKVGGQIVTFEIHNEDTSNATYRYFGYVSSSGSWIVMRQHIAATGKIYAYSAGQARSTYDTNWNATTGAYAGSLSFVTIDQINASL